MPAAANRTFICSVVFLDITEYSRKPVAEQIQLKERLNALLTDVLANVAPNDRIILDTGDGAALSFLGDPEDALFVSLTLRDATTAQSQPPGPELKMRIGINLGPVKVVKDLNGQPNIIGDGINVAQRVMTFSNPGQILVSRSYYEVVSCLSEEYIKLFHYEGSRTDKHVREHEVYAVGAANPAMWRGPASKPAQGIVSTTGAAVLDRLSQSAAAVTQALRQKPRVSTALVAGLILATAVGLRVTRGAPEKPAPQISTAPAAAPAERRTSSAPIPDKPAAAEPASKTQAPAGVALVTFAISPWGEIYVDGKPHGVTPPLRNLEIDSGKHKIEVRNTDFPPYVETVDAKPGGRIRIRHTFR